MKKNSINHYIILNDETRCRSYRSFGRGEFARAKRWTEIAGPEIGSNFVKNVEHFCVIVERLRDQCNVTIIVILRIVRVNRGRNFQDPVVQVGLALCHSEPQSVVPA